MKNPIQRRQENSRPCNSDLSPLRFCRIKRMHWSRTSTVDLINTIKAQFELSWATGNIMSWK